MDEPRRKLDEYGSQEMAIPEWRLIQKTGGDYAKEMGGKLGQFYNALTDEFADELNIVVVDILSGRAKWGEEVKNVGPACASLDARSNKSIYGTDCNECEYRVDAPWSMDAKERRTMCCLNYTILGIDLDHDYMPAMIRAHGVSALPARQLITQLKMNKALKGEYYRAIINIKSMEKDTIYGTTYALRPKIVKLITDEVQAEELKVESQRLLGAPISLPEARPEEEGEPLGYTPGGVPFYSEEERDELIAKEAETKATRPDKIEQETKKEVKEKTIKQSEQKTEQEKQKVKEAGKQPAEEIDVNF